MNLNSLKESEINRFWIVWTIDDLIASIMYNLFAKIPSFVRIVLHKFYYFSMQEEFYDIIRSKRFQTIWNPQKLLIEVVVWFLFWNEAIWRKRKKSCECGFKPAVHRIQVAKTSISHWVRRSRVYNKHMLQ